MHYESLNHALIDAVKALGGSKQVGHKLWPEKTVDAAQRHLLACLNEDKAERLTPDHLMLLLRMARDVGHHAAYAYMSEQLSYAEPLPISPRDELAELLREFMESRKGYDAKAERIEKALSTHLRAVA